MAHHQINNLSLIVRCIALLPGFLLACGEDEGVSFGDDNEPTSVVPVDLIGDYLGERELEYTTAYAEINDIALEAAATQRTLTDMAGELQAELAEFEPDLFAGLWIEREPEFRIIVAMTGDEQEGLAAIDLATAGSLSPLRKVIEPQSADVSLRDMISAQEDITSRSDQFRIDSTSDIDVTTGRVILFVADLEDVARMRAVNPVPDLVAVVHDAEPEKDDTWDSNHGLSSCTSGFVVMNTSTAAKYMTTAGHCTTGGITYSGKTLSYVGRRNGSNSDLQWRSVSGVTLQNRAYQGGGVHTTILATKHRNNMVVNDYVCRTGKASSTNTMSCSFKITTTSRDPGVGYNGTFIRVKRTNSTVDPAAPGDSGMGWKYASTAFGWHKGSSSSRATFMAQNYASDSGLAVWAGGI
ncbi:MAG: hypothetical protein V3V08_05165 [Nannocystaceae bacterium]